MTSPGGRTGAALVALILLGCSPRPGHPTPGGGNTRPAPPPPLNSAPAQAATPSPSPAGSHPRDEQSPVGGLFGSPPAANRGAPSTTTVAPAPGRTDPTVVARAYATGLCTVDWTRPLPGAQKLTAAAPWATTTLTAKLVRGQHYQPASTDPRVVAGQVDTVERVLVEDADPVPGANAYLATINIRTSSSHGTTTSQASLLLTVIRQPGGWLVDDSQVVG